MRCRGAAAQGQVLLGDFAAAGRFFENTVTPTVDLASIRYVTLRGNARSCRHGSSRRRRRRALRAVSANCYVRTPRPPRASRMTYILIHVAAGVS